MESTMDLIERYIADVAHRLPKRMRNDVAAELRSSLGEAFDASVNDFNRDNGRMATDEDRETLAVDLVKKFGSPASLASSYRPGPQWLIGPELYPAFLKTLKIVSLVIIGLVGLSLGLDAIDEGPSSFLKSMAQLTTGGLLSNLVSAMGWVVLVFWIIQLTSWRKHGAASAGGGSMDVFGAPAYSGTDAGSWDPRDLPKADDPDRISRTQVTVEIAIMLALLVLFNVFPNAIGASVEVNGDRGWVPILGDGFLARLTLLNIGFIGVAIHNMMLLRHNRWTIPTRILEIVMNVVFLIALLPLVTQGDAITLDTSDLLAKGCSLDAANALVDNVFPILDTVLRGAFAIACIGLAIETAKCVVKLVKRVGS
jgi:hypothetical protein